MLTFVTLSCENTEAAQGTDPHKELDTSTIQEIRRRCPNVEWLHNGESAHVGAYQHIFITPDVETAEEVAEIICHFGFTTPEVWTATDWMTYKRMLKKMPEMRVN